MLFTDLAGFTPLMEANARCGQVGIEMMLAQLNAYFTTMIEILSKSGGGSAGIYRRCDAGPVSR